MERIEAENRDEQDNPQALPDLGTEPLWTVDEVARYLRLNSETIRIMARRGELPSIKIGKRVWRFRVSEVRNWLLRDKEAEKT